jgi:hypothetical protein
MIETQQSRELPPAEALRLLACVPFGRVIFTSRAMPAVRPVRHVMTDGAIIIAVGPELVLGFPGPAEPIRPAVAQRPRPGPETIVAYEADELDSTGCSGWSVVVVGRARAMTDSAEVRRYRALLPAMAAPDQLVAISTDVVTGFRLAQAAPYPVATPTPKRNRAAAGNGASRTEVT